MCYKSNDDVDPIFQSYRMSGPFTNQTKRHFSKKKLKNCKIEVCYFKNNFFYYRCGYLDSSVVYLRTLRWHKLSRLCICVDTDSFLKSLLALRFYGRRNVLAGDNSVREGHTYSHSLTSCLIHISRSIEPSPCPFCCCLPQHTLMSSWVKNFSLEINYAKQIAMVSFIVYTSMLMISLLTWLLFSIIFMSLSRS